MTAARSRGIHRRIGQAQFGGHGDFSREFGEELGANRVLLALLVHDILELTVTGHTSPRTGRAFCAADESEIGAPYTPRPAVMEGAKRQPMTPGSIAVADGFGYHPGFLDNAEQEVFTGRNPVDPGRGAAVSSAHAADGQALLGAHEQLRLARLGVGRGGLPISADASRNRAGLAAHSGAAPRGLGEARSWGAPAGGLPHQFLRRQGEDGVAPGPRRTGPFRAGRLPVARRHGAVPPRRAQEKRPDALFPARVGRRHDIERAGAVGVPRR